MKKYTRRDAAAAALRAQRRQSGMPSAHCAVMAAAHRQSSSFRSAPGAGADIGARLFAEQAGGEVGQGRRGREPAGRRRLCRHHRVSSAPTTITRCCSPQPAASPCIRISMTSCPTMRATSRRLRASPTRCLRLRRRTHPGSRPWRTWSRVPTDATRQAQRRAGSRHHRIRVRRLCQGRRRHAAPRCLTATSPRPATDLGEGRIDVDDGRLSPSCARRCRPDAPGCSPSTTMPAPPPCPTCRPRSKLAFPSLEVEGLVGLFGPPSMPMELRDRIAADIPAKPQPIRRSMTRLTATAQVLNPGSPAEFAAAIAAQRTTVANIAQQLGVKAAQ